MVRKGKLIEKWGRKTIGASVYKTKPASCRIRIFFNYTVPAYKPLKRRFFYLPKFKAPSLDAINR
jgi:hypothetical protein